MKMLGRYQVPGCCPGTRAGRDPGPDCGAGGPMEVRRAKRIESRGTAREIATGLEDYVTDLRHISECGECLAYLDAHPHLTGACASVGIEHGKSAAQMVRDYLAAYHERGHQETP